MLTGTFHGLPKHDDGMPARVLGVAARTLSVTNRKCTHSLARCFSTVKHNTIRDAFTLERINVDYFRQMPDKLWRPAGARAVFGGQIIASAIEACHQSLLPSEHQKFELQSLHSYFLLPGDPSQPILYQVKRVRDGRSFATRTVVASQGEHAIFTCEVSFHISEESPLHDQTDMPSAPAPETLQSTDDLLRQALLDPKLPPPFAGMIKRHLSSNFPVEVRPVIAHNYLKPVPIRPARQRIWVRCTENLGGDLKVHRAAVAYASDWSLASKW